MSMVDVIPIFCELDEIHQVLGKAKMDEIHQVQGKAKLERLPTGRLINMLRGLKPPLPPSPTTPDINSTLLLSWPMMQKVCARLQLINLVYFM